MLKKHKHLQELSIDLKLDLQQAKVFKKAIIQQHSLQKLEIMFKSKELIICRKLIEDLQILKPELEIKVKYANHKFHKYNTHVIGQVVVSQPS